jgi:hypothetical protein
LLRETTPSKISAINAPYVRSRYVPGRRAATTNSRPAMGDKEKGRRLKEEGRKFILQHFGLFHVGDNENCSPAGRISFFFGRVGALRPTLCIV